MNKELKWFLPNQNTGLWMSLGMASIGLPIGVSFGLGMENMAYLGLGLPIGMMIGMLIGRSMDQTAQKEGRVVAPLNDKCGVLRLDL